jgi:hypothetical protein
MKLVEKRTRMNVSGSQTADWAFLMKTFCELGKRANILFP